MRNSPSARRIAAILTTAATTAAMLFAVAVPAHATVPAPAQPIAASAAQAASAAPAAPATAAATKPAPAQNVALATAGATVTASGQEVVGKWGPELAIDGDTTTRWSSDHSDNAWITVKLAAPTAIDHVAIAWEAACAKTYKLQVSTDGAAFTDATDVLTPVCGTRDVEKPTKLDATTPYQYVRMQTLSRTPIGGTLYGVSLFEFEVWNGPEVYTPPSRVQSILPKPAETVERADDPPFVVTGKTRIVADKGTKAAAEYLRSILRTSTGYALPVVDSKARDGDIELHTGTVAGYEGQDEAYRLDSTKSRVTITAPSDHGAFNGIQTLRQLLPAFAAATEPVDAVWDIPAATITDAPRFAYRGVMLDVARSFLTVDEVKQFLDTMAEYKLSVLHFHIADDQGWRIQITNAGKEAGDPIDYTKLTKVSGATGMTMGGYQNELGHTGYYTQAQYKDLVKYAAERHIEVIPEIDTPGHTNAALHALPQLNTAGTKPGVDVGGVTPANGSGDVGYSTLDANAPITWTFMRHVLGQVAAITPGPYLHVGGDESHSTPHDDYVTFVTKSVQLVHDLGKKMIGWNESAIAGVQADDGLQYWTGGTQDTLKAIKDNGAKLIVSRGSSAYLDQKYNAKTPIGLTWAGGGDFKTYFDWDPAAVVKDGAANLPDSSLLGVEGPMWSETIRGGAQAQFLAFPRAISIASIGWTPQAQRSVADFTQRMSGVGQRLLAGGVNFYDGPDAKWQWSLAGLPVKVAPQRDIELQIGRAAAPGTVATTDGTAITTDTTDDADGVSSSAVGTGVTATVDWGDGTPATPAGFQTDTARTSLSAGGLYTLTGTHSYAKAGTYTGTVTASDGTTAPFTVKVVANAPDPHGPKGWNPAQKPRLNVDSTARADSRLAGRLTGFEPGSYVTMSLGDTVLGTVRPDAKGTFDLSLPIDVNTYRGTYTVTAKAGDRVATDTVKISSDLVPLADRIDQKKLSVNSVDSEHASGAGETDPATNAIDGDPNTFWHTEWTPTAAPYPHWIVLDLGSRYDVSGLSYLQRAGQSNGRMKDYQVYVSDSTDAWGDPVATGSFLDVTREQVVEFAKAKAGRYVKLVGTSSINGAAFGGAAEINVGGKPVPTGPASVSFPGNDGKKHTVTSDAKSLKVDGTRLNVFSGEFHYWREPSTSDWRDIFQKMRAAGFNAVSLYFFWGLHSSQPGKYDFSGIKDIDKLLTMAQQEGLYVIARPGPYINAEVSMGGLPAYLASNGAGSLRSTDDPAVVAASKDWLHAFDKIAIRHLVTDGGGSIVLYQVENEMPGDTGSRAAFMKQLTAQVRQDGVTVPLFHNDYNLGGRFVPGKAGDGGNVGLDLYGFDNYPLGFTCNASRGQLSNPEASFRTIDPNSPIFIPEGQGGAFTPWGASFNTDKCADFVDPAFTRQYGVNNLGNGVTLFNYYMEFGGTNWGWTGSPSSGFTSYDYGAALNENRQLTAKLSTQKQLGYFQKALPQLSDMIPQTAPATTTTAGDGAITGYERISTENQAKTSVTGNGTRVLAFRKTDSNSTSDVGFTVPLTLGAASTPVEKSYTTDDTDTTAIAYTGSWQPASGKSWTAGDYKGTETYSNKAGDAASYTFTGTGIQVISPEANNHGYADVYLDGTKVDGADLNTYKDQNALSQVIAFQKDGLTDGQHTIKIVVRGTKPAGSLDTFVSIDAFNVLTAATAPGGGGDQNAVHFDRIPQKAGTSLTLHGRDALMVTADDRFGDHELYYTTSELVGVTPTAAGDVLTLDGVKGDAGETVLHFGAQPTVKTLTGKTVESVWNAKDGTLRLNYTHGDAAVVSVAAKGVTTLLVNIVDRTAMGTVWQLDGDGAKGAAARVLASGVQLVRTVTIDGRTARLTGDADRDSTLSVYVPAGVTKLTWNGADVKAKASATGALVASLAGPPKADLPALAGWKVASDTAEAASSFNDAGWDTAAATTAANTQQGPGPKQKVVLDTAYYGYDEGYTWYRAHFTPNTAPATISLQGQGGTAAHMMVWINGSYAGAYAANGSAQRVTVPAGAITAGASTVVAVLVSNNGQNLDWSDNGLSRQNRGLYDADFGATGPVTWKIQGAKGKDAAIDTARTIYNTGGLHGERAGWYLPGYPDQNWKDAASFQPEKAGVYWYRTSFELHVPKGVDTAYAVKVNDAAFAKDRSDNARAVIYVNGWNTGIFVGNVGPQSQFTIPRGFLNLDGRNDIAIQLSAERDGAGPDSFALVDAGTVRGGVASVHNSAPDYAALKDKLDAPGDDGGVPVPVTDAGAPRTIPGLAQWDRGTGTLLVKDTLKVGGDAASAAVVTSLAADLGAKLGRTVATTDSPGAGDVVLTIDPSQKVALGDEGYRLTIDDRIRITAATDTGVFYGAQTVVQILGQGTSLPRGSSVDKPAYAERGVGVCACQITVTPEFLTRLMKDMASVKLNQLWMETKVESSAYSKANFWGYYTKDEARQLSATAKKYHITLVPEVNSPGHMQPWLQNYPELQLVDKNGNRDANRLDITQPEAYTMITKLIDEYLSVFDTPYWHMGGDEYMLGSAYSNYPQFQKEIDAHPELYPAGSTPTDVVVNFMNRIDDYVKGKGKTLRIWNDSILTGTKLSLNKDIVVEHWNSGGSMLTPQALLAAGHKVENSSYGLYLIRQNGADPLDPRALWNSGWTPRKFYGISGDVADDAASGGSVVGAKLTTWPDTATAKTQNQVEDALFADDRALAQATWGSPRPVASYDDFAALGASIGHVPGYMNADRTPVKDGAYAVAADGKDVGVSSSGTLTTADPPSAFTFTHTADDYYTIAAADGRCLTMTGGTLWLNAPLDQGRAATLVTCSGGDNLQKWEVRRSGDTLTVANAITLEPLTVADGVLVQQAPDVEKPAAITLAGSVSATLSAPASIARGASGEATLQLVNTRGSDIRDIAVTVTAPDGWTIGTITPPAGTLKAGDKTTVQIPVQLSATAALSGSLTATVTYADAASGKTGSVVASATVLGTCSAKATSPKALVRVDSAENDAEKTPGQNAIDGDPNTFWGTQWSKANPGFPHEITVDLGEGASTCGIFYLPRQSSPNGTIAGYEVYLSDDPASPTGQPVASGTFSTGQSLKQVSFGKEVAGRYLTLRALGESGPVKTNTTTVAELTVDAAPAK